MVNTRFALVLAVAARITAAAHHGSPTISAPKGAETLTVGVLGGMGIGGQTDRCYD